MLRSFSTPLASHSTLPWSRFSTSASPISSRKDGFTTFSVPELRRSNFFFDRNRIGDGTRILCENRRRCFEKRSKRYASREFAHRHLPETTTSSTSGHVEGYDFCAQRSTQHHKESFAVLLQSIWGREKCGGDKEGE